MIEELQKLNKNLIRHDLEEYEFFTETKELAVKFAEKYDLEFKCDGYDCAFYKNKKLLWFWKDDCKMVFLFNTNEILITCLELIGILENLERLGFVIAERYSHLYLIDNELLPACKKDFALEMVNRERAKKTKEECDKSYIHEIKSNGKSYSLNDEFDEITDETKYGLESIEAMWTLHIKY